jgi:four helix bundle protein
MEAQLKQRTKKIGLAVIRLIDELRAKPSANEIAWQITRSSTSVGANYRAACRSKSPTDFIYKLQIVEEVSDETFYWLEVLEEANLIDERKIVDLKKEVDETIAIMVSSMNTMKNKTSR